MAVGAAKDCEGCVSGYCLLPLLSLLKLAQALEIWMVLPLLNDSVVPVRQQVTLPEGMLNSAFRWVMND